MSGGTRTGGVQALAWPTGRHPPPHRLKRKPEWLSRKQLWATKRERPWDPDHSCCWHLSSASDQRQSSPKSPENPGRKVKMKPNCYLIKGHTPAWDKRSTWLGSVSMTTQLPHWQWAGLGNKSIRLPISLTLLLSTQTGLLVRDKKGAIILGKWGKNHLPQRNPWKITKTTTIKTINLQIYK